MNEKPLSARGFSFPELMVVIAIMGLMVTAATFGYVQYAKRVTVDSAASAVASVLMGARQAAASTRTARRVGLDLANERVFVERRLRELAQFDASVVVAGPGGTEIETVNALVIGESRTDLPDGADIIDVNGWGPRHIEAPEKIYYIEFDNQGRNVKGYRKGHAPADPNQIVGEGLSIHVGRRFGKVVLPSDLPADSVDSTQKRRDVFLGLSTAAGHFLVPEVAADPGSFKRGLGSAGAPLWERSETSQTSELEELVGVFAADQLPRLNDSDFPVDIVMVRLEQEARAQVHTVVVLAITGRVHAFPYGLGFPWSNVEMIELLGNVGT